MELALGKSSLQVLNKSDFSLWLSFKIHYENHLILLGCCQILNKLLLRPTTMLELIYCIKKKHCQSSIWQQSHWFGSFPPCKTSIVGSWHETWRLTQAHCHGKEDLCHPYQTCRKQVQIMTLALWFTVVRNTYHRVPQNLGHHLDPTVFWPELETALPNGPSHLSVEICPPLYQKNWSRCHFLINAGGLSAACLEGILTAKYWVCHASYLKHLQQIKIVSEDSAIFIHYLLTSKCFWKELELVKKKIPHKFSQTSPDETCPNFPFKLFKTWYSSTSDGANKRANRLPAEMFIRRHVFLHFGSKLEEEFCKFLGFCK